jgi:hypothetical protein
MGTSSASFPPILGKSQFNGNAQAWFAPANIYRSANWEDEQRAAERTHSERKSGSLRRFIRFQRFFRLCPCLAIAGFEMLEHFQPKYFRSAIEGRAKKFEHVMVTVTFHFYWAPVTGSNKKQTSKHAMGSNGYRNGYGFWRLFVAFGIPKVRGIRPFSVIFRAGLIELISYICQSAVCWLERDLSCSSCDAIFRCEAA